MSLSIEQASDYISQYVINIEDWLDADDSTKQRLLNVSQRTLESKFPKHYVPMEAIYEYSAVLSTIFNDTYKGNQYGVKQFTIDGMSFTFNGNTNIEELIPNIVYELIGIGNNLSSNTVRVGRMMR